MKNKVLNLTNKQTNSQKKKKRKKERKKEKKKKKKKKNSVNLSPRLVYDSSKRSERVARSPRAIRSEFFGLCQTLARFSPKSDRVTKTRILLQKSNALLIPTILSYRKLLWG